MRQDISPFRSSQPICLLLQTPYKPQHIMVLGTAANMLDQAALDDPCTPHAYVKKSIHGCRSPLLIPEALMENGTSTQSNASARDLHQTHNLLAAQSHEPGSG